jgi:DNA-binding IclR family transcriptional regulator
MLSCLDEQAVKGILRKQALTAYTTNTVKSIEQLFADVRAVHKRGYAIDNEEIEIGLRCVGAPIRDHTGGMVGAISAAAPSARLTEKKIPVVGRLVMAVAAEISEELGYEKPAKTKPQ